MVLIEDGVSTASKQHFNAIEVMRGAAAKVLLAQDVVKYFQEGRPVKPPVPKAKLAGTRLARTLPAPTNLASTDVGAASSRPQRTFADAMILLVVASVGPFSFAAGWMLRGQTLLETRQPLL